MRDRASSNFSSPSTPQTFGSRSISISNPSDARRFDTISAAIFCAKRPSASRVTERGSRMRSANNVASTSGRANVVRKLADDRSHANVHASPKAYASCLASFCAGVASLISANGAVPPPMNCASSISRRRALLAHPFSFLNCFVLIELRMRVTARDSEFDRSRPRSSTARTTIYWRT